MLSDFNKFRKDHPLIWFSIGLGALLVFAAWPEYIEPWWPSWLRYTPLHDKLHNLRSAHAELKTAIGVLRQETIDELRKLGDVIVSVNARTYERLNALDQWVGHNEPHGGLWRDLVIVRGEVDAMELRRSRHLQPSSPHWTRCLNSLCIKVI